MKALDEILPEAKVTAIAAKILEGTKKAHEQLTSDFYNEIQSYLYEHFDSFQSDLRNRLIRELADEYISEPDNYKFTALRKQMFEENKEALTADLTEEGIYQYLSSIMWQNVGKEPFAWKWKEGIARFILDNWNTFKDDERIKMVFGNDRERLISKIAQLNKQIDDVNSALDA